VREKFFSAYIPGISGIPNKEERRSKKVILKACSYGDSNVILRNALFLLNEENKSNLKDIERWIAEVFGEISISVKHNENKDLHITCEVSVQGVKKPIELVGTGFIQLIQIFCYVLLFKPGVLLIDEPDIHLHPDVQEKLVAVLGAWRASGACGYC
jgi:AAA15 family ATPase/GTPase